MALSDALAVLGVFIGLGYVILAKMNKSNPQAMQWLKGAFKVQKPETPSMKDSIQQVYDERRSMM
jgi:hypothetical protein